MADTKKRVKLNTPRGVAKFPKLTTPDYGSPKFPKPEGEYSVRMVFDEADPAFQKFAAKLRALEAAAEENALAQFAELKKPQRDKIGAPKLNPIFTPIYDDEDEPTGKVEMKLSTQAAGTVKQGPRKGKKWSRTIPLFDAFNRPVKGAVEIWGGSELIVSFTVDEGGYFIVGSGAYGIKAQLEAVQIITLRQGGERSADDYGFGAQEDGFDASDIPDKQADADDDEGADDFDRRDGADDGAGEGYAGDPAGADEF